MGRYHVLIAGLVLSISGVYGQNTAPTDITLNGNTLFKNAVAGSVVGKLTAVDDSLGVLMAWGDNTYGKIGDGTADYTSTPIKFSDGFILVEGGYTHDLGIKADGSLWAWGDNSWGQLGNGTQIEAAQPIKIGDGYTSVACNAGFSLAIKSDGSLWAWGFNGYSQLGDGSTANRVVPYKVGDGYMAVVAGYQHVLALKNDGSLWAWGDNSKGQLGDGTKINRSVPTKVGDGYEKIDAADNSSFGIKQDGSLWAWGVNSTGQLGLGNKTDVQSPTKVGDSFTSVSGGVTHTLAIKIDGSLWAWGDNQRGQLGNGTNTSTNLPSKIGDGYRMVSAGHMFSLFLDQSGKLFSSGYNAKGQLGDGSTVDSYTLRYIGDGYLTIADIDAGQYALAISSDGGLWTWGRIRADINQFKILPLVIGKDYTIVAVGQDHSLGLKSDGTLWAWGDNTSGQLGIGSRDSKSVPIKVGLGFTAIAAGGACSLALKNGNLYVWGNNSGGLLGVFGGSVLSEPTNTGLEFASIAAGGSFFLGIKSDGSLWSWGQNYVGQLGDGTTISKTIPVKIGDGYTKITAGATHALALKTDGSLWAWGDNSYGQVGDGTMENKSVPVKIGDGFSVIAAGQYQSFGIKSDGTFWSWGSNSNGALGDGTFNELLAIPTKNDDGFSDVSGGQFSSFGIKNDGSLWAWGLNSRGSFGNGAMGTSVSRTKVKVADGYVAASTYNHTLALRSVRFSLVNGVGSDDNNSFRIDGDQLKTVIQVDGSKSSYSVRIRATDYSGLFFEKQLQIPVSDFSPEPTQQPTSLSFSSVTTTSFSIGYAASASNPTGYLIIRKTNSYPTTDPIDGIVYTAGASVGDGQVVYVGTALSVNETALSVGTVYYYKIYAYNGSNSNINYLQVNPLMGFQSTMVMAPTAQPTSLTFSNIGLNSMTVNYNAAAGSPAGYLALRKAGSYSSDFPIDGTVYTAGESLGDGTVAYVGNALTFADSGLSPATVYYYKIYSYNGAGSAINYLQSAPLSGSQATSGLANTAPTNITLSATSITENQPIGTTIGTLSATDAEGGAMSYTLVAGTGDTNNASFTISGTSLKSAIVFDYETKASYSIRIRVTDSGGLSYEKQFTITIIDDPTDPTFEPTAPPTNLTFSNISTSSITVNYTAATGNPSGYLIVRKAGVLPTFVPVDGTAYADGATLGDGSVAYNLSSSPFNDTGLAAGTTYYYQIYSFNGNGTSINYLEASPLSKSQATSADTTPPQISNTTMATQAAGTPVTVSVTVTDAESAVSGVVISYGSSGAAAFSITNAAMTQSATGWSYTIPGSAITDPGVRYRITAQNASGLSSVMNDVIGISYSGSGMPIPYTQFGTKQENYRIIAIPLTLSDNSVNAVFGNALGVYGDINKWRLFHYSGGSTNELSGSSSLERGKGYWLIAAQTATLTTGPGSTAGSLDKPMSIPLTNGWNQIGNPYTYRLAWADIQAANPGLSMTNTLRVFKNGKLDNGTALDSFEGGFIFVDVGSTLNLIYPAEKKNGRVGGTPSPSRPEQNELNWEMDFQLSNSRSTLVEGGLGMYENASDDFDGYDDFTLPRWGEYLELNHHKSLHKTAYTRDVISTKQTHTWEFEVNSSEPEAVHSLTWQPAKLRLAPEKRLVLWDVIHSRPTDMLTHNKVTFTLPARFKVIYGDEDYIKREIATSQFILHAPFPNPTQGKVTVSFQVPDEQDGKRLTLELFDQSGKSIQRVDQSFPSGYHQVTWELASRETKTAGIYLAKLTTASGIYTQKIILIP